MRLLIVEDEPLVRERLQRMCREVLGPAARIAATHGVDDAAELLRARPIDVLLLDLNLAGEDGFHLLRRAVASAFHTIVVSAHAERALEAFELGVVDFVPKPFSRERLAMALDRVRLPDGTPRQTRYLGVWRAHGVGLVPVADVCWLQATGDYTAVRLVNGRRELHDKPLHRLAELLPDGFVRCHRSYLVNLDYAERFAVSSGSRYALVLRDGTRIPVGRSHVETVRGRMG